MGSRERDYRAAWQRIAGDLIADLLELDDAELRAEAKEVGNDVHSEGERIRAMVARAVIARRKARLDKARAMLRESEHGPVNVGLSAEQRRQLVQRLQAGDPALTTDLTLAARKGQELSEGDLELIIEALFHLGKIDEFGNPK